MTSERIKGHICILGTNTIFGIFIPISKYLMGDCVSPLTLTMFRIFGAAVLCALIGALMLAFRYGLLPYASDGDAFDTVYAFGEAGQNDSD